MVEFALVMVLLVMLVLGIVTYGLMLSFKQDLTRAAAEGARVGAVEPASALAPATAALDTRYIAAEAATQDAVQSFDQSCGSGGMTCTVIVHDCGATPVANVTTYWDNGTDDCLTVELEYDYADHPLIVDPPILSGMLPDTLRSRSVVRLNQ